MDLRTLKVFLVCVFALPMAFAVGLIAARVGDEARFVSWPVVAFAVLAAVVAVVGAWTGARQPPMLAVGLLPALLVSYFLPAARFPIVAVVLVGIGAAAIVSPGVLSGLAAGTGALMVVFVALQGPAVECGDSSVSSNGGPWWIDEPSESFGSGTTTAEGISSGTVQIGSRRYRYVCAGGRLRSFQSAARGSTRPRPTPSITYNPSLIATT